MRLVVPQVPAFTILDLLVFLGRIVLLRSKDETGINNLPLFENQTTLVQILHETVEQLFAHVFFSQLFPKQPYRT